MLFPIPGWIRSPRCLNMYITPAQLNVATTPNGILAGGIALGFASSEVSGGRDEGARGLRVDLEGMSRGRRERSVREST